MRPAFAAIIEAYEYMKNTSVPNSRVVGIKSKTWYNKLGIGEKKRQIQNTRFLSTYKADPTKWVPATNQEYGKSQKKSDMNYYKRHPEVGHPSLMYKPGVWEKMGK